MINHRLIAAILLSAALAGCSGKGRKWDVPEEATPEYEAMKLEKSNELVREAQRLELAGKGDAAIEQYNAAIVEYTGNSIAWHNVGRLYAKKGDNVKAANCFRTASELAPSDPRSVYSLGALWEELGYLDDAAKWYDEALIRDPNHLSSLRRAILVDDLRHTYTQTTSDRIRRALPLEREPWWINRFMRIKQRMDEPSYGPDRNVPRNTPAPSPADSPIPLPKS